MILAVHQSTDLTRGEGQTAEREAGGYPEAQARMPPESEQLVVTAFDRCVPSDTVEV